MLHSELSAYTEMPLISSYASMSFARIASSVLNAMSDFSIAVMTPVTSSFFPVARSCTAWLASCCRRETSLMLFLSASAKLAPPVPPAPVFDTPPDDPAAPSLSRGELVLMPSIISFRQLGDQTQG